MAFTLTITEQEAQLILNGLAELPAKLSIDLILKINQTYKEQISDKKLTSIEDEG